MIGKSRPWRTCAGPARAAPRSGSRGRGNRCRSPCLNLRRAVEHALVERFVELAAKIVDHGRLDLGGVGRGGGEETAGAKHAGHESRHANHRDPPDEGESRNSARAQKARRNQSIGRHKSDRRRVRPFARSQTATVRDRRLRSVRPLADGRVETMRKRMKTASREWRIGTACAAGSAAGLRQLNSEETLSSLAMRPIASPIRGAIEITRMLRATRTASVG